MKKMSNWKKKLAILVAVILAVSTVQLVPTVFANMRAENGDSGTIFSRLANTTNTANNPNDENYENGENPADSTFSTEQNDLTEPPQFTSPPAIGGEEEIVDMPTFDVDFNNVIYNLGRQEITVGVDIFRAEETPWNFRLFDSYGNFTIQLEDNAFFPYEVQFQYQGETFIEWFETPQSTVQIGNHIFSVETVQNNPNLLQSISLTIGNDIIKLRPEPKVFTNELFTPATLLPVPLVSLQTIYLAELGYDRLMLQNVTVSHVLSAAEQFNDNAGVVWVRGLGNDYNIVAGSVLDLSRITGTTQLEFIVGTTLQLDPNNVRYRVNVNPELDVIIREVQLFGEDMNGARFEIATNTPEDTSTLDTTSTLQSVTFDIQQPLLGFDNVFLGLSIDPELLNAPNRVLRVLRGNFATPEAALNALNTISGVDITRQIFNPNLSNANTGFAIENAGDHVFTLLFVAQNDLSNVLSLSRLFVSISAERDNFITNVRAFRDIGNTRTVVAEVEPTEPTRGLIPEQSAIFTLEQVDFGDLSSHFITFDLHESINPVRVQIINGWWGSAQTALAAVANAPSLDVTRDILIWNAEIAGRGGFRLTHGFSPNFSIVFYDHLNQVIGFTRLTTYITYSGAFPTVQNVQINQLVDNVRTPVVNQNLFGTGVTQTVNITNFPSAYNFINPPHFLSIALNENLPEHTDVQIVRGIYGNAAAVAAAVSANPQLNVTEDILNHEVGLRLLSSGNQNFGLVFYNEGDVIGFRQLNVNIRVTTPPAPTPGADPYMSMRGALDSNGNPITDYYIMPYQHDTYFSHGFQTIFFLDGDLDLSNVRPVFTNPDDVNVFAGTITEPGLLQESGVTERNFSQGPQQYAALSAVGRRGLRNYIVTFVKLHQGGSQLFVNGINGPQGAIREVFLNSSNNIHDIFIANIGDQPLTGLNVTLNASNVRLDEYWTVGGPGNNTLAAFTTTETPATGSGFYGELPNVAKIRIVADGEGPIFGQLRITANGHEQVIQITGTAGDPFITTEFLYDGVLYVPYQSVIMIHNMYPWNRPSFSIVDGSLPEGLVLRPSGEIYGAPLETGEFTFTVRLDNSHASFASTEAEFTLTILPNSNANVFDQTDVNHEIMQHLGTPIGGDARTGGFLIEDPAEQRLFLSAGLHEEFIDFWLNGTRLLRGIHYEDEPGSTRIIVHEQTLTNLARQTGINTIAAEFRERADVGTDYEVGGRLNRSAQNFTFNRPATGGGDGGDGGNGGNGGNGDQGGGN
ncbi:MAG: putative Ig domain-containing protein, partial [Firmicutes bacterium]|nr:putative Ig domain-containing protein [Bacillota bacterium]